MISLARQIADSHAFQNVILIVILLTAAIVGLETSATLTARYGPVFDGIEVLVQQGALSLEIWTGRKPPLETMRAAARR